MQLKRNPTAGSVLIPYSMMSAVEPEKVGFLGKVEDDQIALNQWARMI